MALPADAPVNGCAAALAIVDAAMPIATIPDSSNRCGIAVPSFSIGSLPIVQAPSARNFPTKTVLPAAATKEAIRVAQNLLTNERIGIRTHHDGVRLVA